jgi:hypothetical protein
MSQLAELLKQKLLTIAVAESCTGGHVHSPEIQKPKHTVPTGLFLVSPVGPAIPVIDTPFPN